MKYCRDCGDELIVGENWTPGLARAKDYSCRKCRKAYYKAWRKTNAESVRASEKAYRASHKAQKAARDRAYHLLHNYGVTPADCDAMLKSQGGGCAICGMTEEQEGQYLCVDHDHETGEVRGLLCRACNLILGNAEDSPDRLRKAIAYLEVHGGRR